MHKPIQHIKFLILHIIITKVWYELYNAIATIKLELQYIAIYGHGKLLYTYIAMSLNLGKRAYVVHTYNFSTLVTHEIYLNWDRCDTLWNNCRTTILISSLKVSNLYAIPCGFYESPNEQNGICELCTFSQIWSCILLTKHSK